MTLNTNISDGNRLFNEVYSASAFLYWIDVNGMYTDEELSPDR
jgi:hypothetical protein